MARNRTTRRVGFVACCGFSAERRHFLASATGLIATLACAPRDRDGAASQPDGAGDDATAGSAESWTLFVGTYTKSGASRGIYQVAVDTHTLAFGEAILAAECAEPSFLALSTDRRVMVAVNELLEFDGKPAGSITAFRHGAATAGRHTLEPLAPVRTTRGAAPCYVTLDRNGHYALVANYLGGNVAVFPVAADGSLGEAVQVVTHEGTGPNAKRQDAPHAHCIVLDAANRFAVSADLGADTLYVSQFDATTGKLTPAAVPEVRLTPGAGPRHVAFSPDGRTLYCVNELDSTLAVFSYDPETGALANRQVPSTRPADATGANAPADIHVHPSGRAVYVSNRGDNTIAVFAVNANTGALVLTQTIASGGDWPRNFTLTPDGAGLLVAHQRSNSIVAFRLDARTLLLTKTEQVLTAPVPVCLLFA